MYVFLFLHGNIQIGKCTFINLYLQMLRGTWNGYAFNKFMKDTLHRVTELDEK